MKKAFTVILFVSIKLNSSPFLTVESVDSVSGYPDVSIKIRISAGIEESAGINEDNFSVYENGFKVNSTGIRSLTEEQSLKLVMGIDCSKSVSSSEFESFKKEAEGIILSAEKDVRFALAPFHDKSFFEAAFTDNKDEITDKLNSFNQKGKETLLYNSIYDSIELLLKNGKGRSAVIVWTDGKDEGSGITADDLAFFARNSGIPIVFITSERSINLKVMNRISKISGGSVYFKGKIEELRRYIRSFKTAYEIRYKTLLNRGNKAKVEVRMKAGRIRDRAETEIDIPEYNSPADSVVIKKKHIIAVSAAVGSIIFVIILIILFKKYFVLKRKIPVCSDKRSYQENSKGSALEEKNSVGDSEIISNKIVFEDNRFKDSENSQSGEYIFHAWLFMKEGYEKGKNYEMTKDEIIIGKSKKSDVSVNDEAVSGEHCKIKFTGEDFVLFDKVSGGGTFLNGKKLLRPKKLYDWDEIRIGTTVLIFRFVSEPFHS